MNSTHEHTNISQEAKKKRTFICTVRTLDAIKWKFLERFLIGVVSEREPKQSMFSAGFPAATDDDEDDDDDDDV